MAHIVNDKKWVARIRRSVVLHRMETADSLEGRVFWAIVLWSICGPQCSVPDASTGNWPVVKKNERGFICTEIGSDNPIPAKQKDLLRLLGLAEGMKGHLSRTLQRLEAKGSIYFKDGILYLTEDPTPPEKAPEVASTGNFHIAGLVVSTGNLPNDPDERAEAVQWLVSLSTEWKSTLKTVKTSYRELLRQGLSERGILIVLEEKKRRREDTSSSSLSADLSTEDPEEPTTTTEPTNEPIQTQDEPLPLKAESVEPVVEALALYGTPDAEAVQSLIHDCREQDPECTVEEIAEAVRQKGSQGVRMRNAIGFLITSVPKVFFGRAAPPPPPAPTVSPGGVCTQCSGSGFVGRIWTTWPEARMLFRAGVPFCECEAGQENEREMRAEMMASAKAM